MSAPKVTKYTASQTIELDEAFGIDFKGNRELREYIGQLIIDRIRTRTEAGIGMKISDSGKGKVFDLTSVPYSKKYVESAEFKNFGKSKNDVNMTLTGDMLGLMDVVDQSGNTITIGWDDDTQQAKAANHIKGVTVPARPFFGISNEELKSIVKEVKPDLEKALDIKKTEGKDAFAEYALGLIDELSNG